MTPQELKYSILGDAFTGKLCENITSEDFGSIKIAELSESPFDVPETWVWSTLGLCCEMYTGNSISETVKAAKYAGLETGYDYIATKDVTFNQEICYDNGVRIPYNEGFKVAYKDAVLMCIEGGSAGRKIGILDRDVCFGNKLCSFHTQGIDNKYLYYYLQSWLFKELFSGNMTGIIGGVSIKKLKEISIPVAPLDEQKKIVAKIEELLPLIDRYEQAWSRLEDFNKRFPVDMQKSILQMAIQGKLVPQLPEEGTGEELFQQIQAEKQRLIKSGTIKKEKSLSEIAEDEIPFDIPDSWKWTKLGRLFVIERGSSPRPIQSYLTSSPDGVNWIKIGDSEVGAKYITSTSEKITTEGAKKSRLVSVGDFIISNSMSYGRPYIMAINGYVHDGWNIIHNIQIDECDVFDKDYLYYVLSSNLLKEQMKAKAAGGVVKNIKSDYLRDLIIPVPPLAEQKRIVAKLEEILPLCERLK